MVNADHCPSRKHPVVTAEADPARAGFASAVPRGPIVSAPLPVIRGAKCQVEGTIDWFRASADGCELLDPVTFRLAEWLGPWRECGGRHGYKLGRRFMYWVEVWYTPSGGMCVDLTGDALALLAWTDKVALPAWLLMHGMYCTRIDVAIDYRAEPLAPAKGGAAITLIEDARRSAERGELCRCRVEKANDEYTNRVRTRHEHDFGRRGKEGSGRYVRIYDKGLETGECPEGRWVRWEAEFSKDHAHEAALKLLSGGPDEAATLLRPLALGCVDFRVNTGDAHLHRRPRVQWFHDLLEDQAPLRVAPRRERSTLQSYAGWVRRAVLPTLADMGTLADCSPADVLADLTADVRPIRDARDNPVAVEYADDLASRAKLLSRTG